VGSGHRGLNAVASFGGTCEGFSHARRCSALLFLPACSSSSSPWPRFRCPRRDLARRERRPPWGREKRGDPQTARGDLAGVAGQPDDRKNKTRTTPRKAERMRRAAARSGMRRARAGAPRSGDAGPTDGKGDRTRRGPEKNKERTTGDARKKGEAPRGGRRCCDAAPIDFFPRAWRDFVRAARGHEALRSWMWGCLAVVDA